MKPPDMCPYCGHAHKLDGYTEDDEDVELMPLACHNNNRWSCYNDECWRKAEQNEEYEFGMYYSKIDFTKLRDIEEI